MHATSIREPGQNRAGRSVTGRPADGRPLDSWPLAAPRTRDVV